MAAPFAAQICSTMIDHRTALCNNFSMARKYELKRRAERQEETRRRIIEAAIELHRTKGPARTTVSDVARLANVQRHTLYRHFPSELDLGLACSGLYMERSPPPDAAAWADIADLDERRRRGLSELYEWFARNEDMFGNVLRDAEVDPLASELFALRAGEALERMRAALGEGMPVEPRTQALLDLAFDFHAWRRLARSGLSPRDAADAMAAAVRCA
jgi:AcrR family transcriptional regulator